MDGLIPNNLSIIIDRPLKPITILLGSKNKLKAKDIKTEPKSNIEKSNSSFL